jgi:hypothetical protein
MIVLLKLLCPKKHNFYHMFIFSSWLGPLTVLNHNSRDSDPFYLVRRCPSGSCTRQQGSAASTQK